MFLLKFSSAYEFLRKQKILPLSCSQTVRRYNVVKSEFGFDENFFNYSNRKYQQKHGLLLCNEIMLCESDSVNSSSLTYSGLENVGKVFSQNQSLCLKNFIQCII